MPHVVKAVLAVVQDAKTGQYHHLYQGAPVPESVSSEDIERLTDEGFIREAPKEQAPAEVDPNEPPKKAASKPEWVAFASNDARGEAKLSAEEAEALTKEQLVEKFGK